MQTDGLENIARAGNRAGPDAIAMRNTFAEYFAHVAPVPWQEAHVNRGVFTE
jgi:hypothetical protein